MNTRMNWLIASLSVTVIASCGSSDRHRAAIIPDAGAPDSGSGGAKDSSAIPATGGAGGSTGGAGGSAGGKAAVDSGVGVRVPDASPADAGNVPPELVDAGSGAGTLSIILTNATLGGDVTITGPNDFTLHVTKSTTLKGIAPGFYSLVSKDVPPVGAGNVSKANPARLNVNVDVNVATATVDYGTKGISSSATAFPPGIWFTQGTTLVSLPLGAPDGNYNADVIHALNPAPTDQFQSPDALAFDAKGGIWLADAEHNIIERISAGGTVTGALGAIDLTPLGVYPYVLAFDKAGDLWVAGQNTQGTQASKVLGFDSPTLAALSAPVYPSSTYSISGNGNTDQMAFDPNGNLWMNFQLVGAVGAFKPALTTTQTASLAYLKGGTHNVQVPIGSNLNPEGVTFDRAGNLWNTNQKSNEVVGYSAAHLAGPINGLVPDYYITLPPPVVNGTLAPIRVAIDPCSSQLYVLTGTLAQERVLRYDVSNPDSPTLVATVTSPDIGGWLTLMGFAANPIPPGMPLYAAGACP
jgi:hypothetical protein